MLRVPCPWPLGSGSPVRPLGVLCCVYGPPGHLAPVYRCAGLVCCVCGVLGHLAPVRACARSVCCAARAVSLPKLAPVHRCARWLFSVACAASLATWLPFTGVPARCVLLRVRCPWPLGHCSPMRPPGVLCCACGVPGYLAPVHRFSCSVCCVACVGSLATWLLFTGVPAEHVVLLVWFPWPLGSCSPVCKVGVLCVRFPWPLGSCSPVCPLGVSCRSCGVLAKLAPVHLCAFWVCCVACAVSLPTWLLLIGVLPRCVVSHVRCPWPLCSCSSVCPLVVLCRVCGVLCRSAPLHQCAHLLCVVACVVSLATWFLFNGVSAQCAVRAVSLSTWLLFTNAPAWCVVLRVRCSSPLGSCSPVCTLRVLCVRCHWPLGSCSPVCPLSVLCRSSGVLGHLSPVHRCVRWVCCVACAVSLANWLLFTGVHACCAVCAVSLATWLLFAGVPAGGVMPLMPCPCQIKRCSPVCPLGVLCCVCGVLGELAPVHRCARAVCCVRRVLGHLATVHRCARSVCRVACAVPLAAWLPFTGVAARCAVYAVSFAPWLLFSGVPARCVLWFVRLPWPLGPRSPVCATVCCVVRSVSLAPWLPLTGVPARCGALCVRRPWLLGSCLPVRPLGVLSCVCIVLGHLPPFRRCACAVCFVWCAAACWVFVCLLWFSRARGVLAGPTRFWCGVCSLGWLWLLGTWCCALVVAGACLPGVPRHPALVRRTSSGRVALSAPVGSPAAVVTSPTRDSRPWFYWAAARGTRRPAQNQAYGACCWPPLRRCAGLAPRRTGLWPRDGLVPGGSLRRRSPAARAALVLRVLTRSLRRPVSHTVRSLTRDLAGAPGLFGVDANTSPCGSDNATPGSACLSVCGCVLACRGVAAGGALVHLDSGSFVAGRGWVRCRARTRPSGRQLLRSQRSRSSSTNRSKLGSSPGEELQGYEPHAPQERWESKPAWAQPSGPQYGMPFAPWVSWMPMQPAMRPLMPMLPMPVLYVPPVTPQPQDRAPSDRTTERENQQLRKKVRRPKDELKGTRSPGAIEAVPRTPWLG